MIVSQNGFRMEMLERMSWIWATGTTGILTEVLCQRSKEARRTGACQFFCEELEVGRDLPNAAELVACHAARTFSGVGIFFVFHFERESFTSLFPGTVAL